MIGLRIRQLRKKYNYTQSDLAAKLGVTAGAVGLWEANKREPDSKILIKLSKIFGVTLDYIIEDNQENTVTVIGKYGTFEKYRLTEADLASIKNLVSSLSNLQKIGKD